MANTVTVRTVLDGSKRVVNHIYLASDGASGELTGQVVVDVSGLTPAATTLTIEKVEWCFSGFDGELAFDATADVPFAVLPAASGWSRLDFTCFGGLSDNSGAGKTGDIVLNTSGFTASGDKGIIIITAQKNR